MKTILRGMESTDGPMEESTLDNGSIIKWKDTASSPGPMVANMSESTKTTRSTAKAPLNGQMAGNT